MPRIDFSFTEYVKLLTIQITILRLGSFLIALSNYSFPLIVCVLKETLSLPELGSRAAFLKE